MPGTILIIDDEEQLRKLLARIISLEGFQVTEAATLKEASAVLNNKEMDVIYNKMKQIILGTMAILSTSVSAQDSASGNGSGNANPLSFSGYVEAYYGYDMNRPLNNTRPGFFYSYTRHNEFTVNLAFMKAAYTTERVRANFALAAGTYMNANYAAEPGVWKNVFEANAGYKISRNRNLWLDIGIMPSHIGFESAVGRDNWNLTRSIVADNSPYFESGAKLSYTTANSKLSLSALALNGWQRITRVEGNSLMSWGTQVYYKPSDKITLNYSSFFGSDKPDSARLYRIYHNFYGIFQISSQIALTAGFDIGTEDKAVTGNRKNTWYSPVGMIRFTPAAKWTFALRGEYYSDANGVIIATGTPNGFKTIGVSTNIDYSPLKNVALRLEWRNLKSKDNVFTDGDGKTSKNNTAVTFSTAIAF